MSQETHIKFNASISFHSFETHQLTRTVTATVTLHAIGCDLCLSFDVMARA